MNKTDLEYRFTILSHTLLSELNEDGFWTGKLSSSALAVAVAAAALHFHNPQKHSRAIQLAFSWLKANINTDGSYGDTPESAGNISTSLLVYAALNLYSHSDESLKAIQNRLASYLQLHQIDIHSNQVAEAILNYYQKDYTFSVPILTLCALCGIPENDAFKKIPQLPFELALLPKRFYRLLNLSVVSYAIPALIAVGIVIFKKKKSGKLMHWFRKGAEKKALQILHDSMPASGGFLEAIPLTAFVALSLINAGYGHTAVVEKGIDFLKRTQREDGGFPIDIDLSTWVTSLSIKALGNKIDLVLSLEAQEKLTVHLKQLQNKTIHPFNRTLPGGWGWTHATGAVPDADDTPGVILALLRICPHQAVLSEVLLACEWLIKLQNRDGGFPTFSRGWGKLPFDRSCADLSGHAFLALATVVDIYGHSLTAKQKRKITKALAKTLNYLKDNQQEDGAWLPLWFGNQQAPNGANPVYGTARVLTYLNDAIIRLKQHPELANKTTLLCNHAAQFLLAVQNTDGSWGGNKNLPGTIEETALSVSALQQSQYEQSRYNGLRWLDGYVQQNGLVPSPIGLYFASLWYHEKMYPLTAYLEAVVRSLESNKE